MNFCSRTPLSCQKLDNRALFDEKDIGSLHCTFNMAIPPRVALWAQMTWQNLFVLGKPRKIIREYMCKNLGSYNVNWLSY
jgi:hypothetical protein